MGKGPVIPSRSRAAARMRPRKKNQPTTSRGTMITSEPTVKVPMG